MPTVLRHHITTVTQLVLLLICLTCPITLWASPLTEVISFQEGSQITLTWKAPTDSQIIGYAVYRGNDLNSLARLAVVGASSPNEATGSPPATLYTDTAVSPGSSYYYKVRPIDTSGYEGIFSTATATTLYQPTISTYMKGYPSVIVTGDFNGDGKTDVAIGYPTAPFKGKSRGKVSIYFGTTGSKQVVTELYGQYEKENFGKTLAVADLNRDGYSDLIVGAPQYTEPVNTGLWDEGKVYIFAGGPTFSKTPVQTIVGGEISAPGGTYYAGERMGDRLISVGDVNGDGYPDIAIGTPSGGYARSGSVYLLYGSNPIGSYTAKVYGLSNEEAFGSSIAPAGDTTGDGINDIWASYAGTAPGVRLIKGGQYPQIDGARTIRGGPDFTAVDFNGDGYSDIVMVKSINGYSYLYIYSGAPEDGGKLLTTLFYGNTKTFASRDIDGDGTGEIIGEMGAIYFGHNGLPRTPFIRPNQFFPVIGVEDVNGDGFPDIIFSDFASNTTKILPLNLFQGLPKISITSGSDTGNTTTSSTNITGSITGSPNLLLVGGNEVPLAADGSFSAALQLVSGKNIFEVIARAADGRLNKRYLIVNSVTTPLTVTITSPLNGSTLTTNPVTVQGTVSEPNAAVTVNGIDASVTGTSWTATISLANGQQTITANATDSYKRTATASLVVTYSTEIPTGTILGTVTDTNGAALPVANITLLDAASNSHSTNSNLQGRYSLLKVATGPFYAQFSKAGFIGQTIAGSLAANQTLDLSVQLMPAPALQIAINTPLAGTVFHAAQAVVTGTVTNAATVTVNGAPADVNGANFTTTTPLTQGSNQIVATAQDSYGQNATASVPVIYLPGPLLMDITATPVAASAIKVAWRTDQPATGTVDYGITSDYGSQALQPVSGYDHTTTISGLKPGGSYHLKISSTNNSGFTTTSADISVTLPIFSVSFTNDQGNVGVYAIEGSYDAKSTDGGINDTPRKAVAQEYFKNHPDKDFLVFFSTFDYAMPEPSDKGFYLEVKNDTQGINRSILNNSAQYGSSGLLQGTIDMGNITALTAATGGAKLDETVFTLNHELGHRWLAAVRYKQPDGSLSNALIGKDNAHWSYLLDSKGSLMYGNGWKDNGNGTFTAVATQNSFSALDLYLMGMIPKEQVPAMLLIDNPAIDKTRLPELGATISGTAKTVTINDIIAAEGERVPNSSTSQKRFNIGFILLTRAGDNSSAAVQAVETVRNAFAGKFAELTRGIGGIEGVAPSLTLTIDTPASGATITGPDTTVSGSFINSTGAETGVTINGVPATVSGSRFIANRVPLQPGDNTLTITATDAGGLTTTVTKTVTAQAGHYLRISSNTESGTGPLDISLRVDGSFTPTNPQLSIQGPATVTIQAGAQPNEYSAKLTVEGAYTITATAQGPDGQNYTASTTITVLNRAQLEALLQGKWEALINALSTNNANNALNVLHSKARSRYQEIFAVLGAQLPSIVASRQEFNFISANSKRAKYELVTNENGITYSYEVLFLKEDNGLWSLFEF